MKYNINDLKTGTIIKLIQTTPYAYKNTIASISNVSKDMDIFTDKFHFKADLDIYEIVDNPLCKFEYEIGSTITINRNYNSLKKGETAVIKDFIDESKTKIIIDGITPGGWISKNHICPIIDFNNYRMKTNVELSAEFGINFLINGNSYMSSNMMKFLGHRLSAISSGICITSSSDGIVIKGSGVNGIYITENGKPVDKYEMYVKSKSEIQDIIDYFDAGTDAKNNILPIAGKKFLDILEGNNPLRAYSIEKLLDYILQNQQFSFKMGKQIDSRFLELVKIN